MRIILATSNKDKVREIKEIFTQTLSDLNPSVIPWDELVVPFEIEENGSSFKENALIKSKAVFRILSKKGLLDKNDFVLSDDSGICVDKLGGIPGIYSARYSALYSDKSGSAKENLELLLKEVEKLEGQTSRAHYCASIGISSFFGDFSTHGFMNGCVIAQKRGENGFGYDPMFIPHGFKHTLAELDAESKNNISHRKIALDLASLILRALKPIL
ncbi:MAG: RdgB/HAM1 family non-canonical purine NTP pyrophosphatase [Helicobacter sp.]|nr:RdgB/HAM1 family non-canonical purine NTP pyrophosphatase [Helicobacter sp.]